MISVAVFIDGLNLYHAIKDLNIPYLKWLDLSKLSYNFINPQYEKIEFIKYFKTLTMWEPDRMQRHQTYIRAIESKGVETVYGKFKLRDVLCKICGH
jgi:hypothetical protein